MALANGSKTYNTFTKGIITEASPLTFPENASVDEENFVLNIDGSRERRQGIDYEENYVLSALTYSKSIVDDQAITVNDWPAAGNDGSQSFIVVQVGVILHFFESKNQSLSGTLSTTIDITAFKSPFASNIGSAPIQTSVGNGVLYIVSKDTEPFYLTYDASSGIKTINTPVVIDVQYRDFTGIDDSLEIDERPDVPITDEHKYNLTNQGWLEEHITTYEVTGKSPSNSDIWLLGKNATDDFSAAQLNKSYVGDSPAPKGHFRFNVFKQDYNSKFTSTGTITTTEERNRFTTTAFYAGRVWYAGVQSDLVAGVGTPINSVIYYSQILTDVSKSGNCFQSADPTSEDISDLISTDGGALTIPEIDRVWKIIPIRNSLLIFANNGIWQLRGGGDTGFDATNFELIKITNSKVYNADCIVVVEDVVMYWADAGIYALAAESIGGSFKASNISKASIQTLYNNISNVGKLYCRGVYDHISKVVTWLYNDSDTYDGAVNRYSYDTELLFNTQLVAFYKNTFGFPTSNIPQINSAVVTRDLITQDIAYNIVINDVQVHEGGVPMVTTLSNPASGVAAIKYLTLVPDNGSLLYRITFSELSNTKFTDWETKLGTDNGIDYVSFIETGQDIFGTTHKTKQVKFLVMHFKRTETGFIETGGGPPN